MGKKTDLRSYSEQALHVNTLTGCFFSDPCVCVRLHTPLAPNYPPPLLSLIICIKIQTRPHSLCSCFLSLPELLPSCNYRILQLQIFSNHTFCRLQSLKKVVCVSSSAPCWYSYRVPNRMEQALKPNVLIRHGLELTAL